MNLQVACRTQSLGLGFEVQAWVFGLLLGFRVGGLKIPLLEGLGLLGKP